MKEHIKHYALFIPAIGLGEIIHSVIGVVALIVNISYTYYKTVQIKKDGKGKP